MRVWDVIVELVQDQYVIYDTNKIRKDTKFVADLGSDSLDYVEFIMYLEEELSIYIDDSALEDEGLSIGPEEDFTLGDMENFLERYFSKMKVA